MRYVVKNRLKGESTWIKVAAFKTRQQAQWFILDRTKGGVPTLQEWEIEKEREMTAYSVQVAIGGVMIFERDFETYKRASRFFNALSRGTGMEDKDVWLVRYGEGDCDGVELAHKEIKGEKI